MLESLGHDVVDVDNPFPAELEPQFNVVWSSGMAAAPVPDEAIPMLRANTRYWLARGQEATAVELAHAIQFLEATTRDVLTTMDEYDVWLTPDARAAAAAVGVVHRVRAIPTEDHRRELLFTPFTAVYNMAGVPAASLPLHWTEATPDTPSLPVGVMLAGRPGEDGPLFSLLSPGRGGGTVGRPGSAVPSRGSLAIPSTLSGIDTPEEIPCRQSVDCSGRVRSGRGCSARVTKAPTGCGCACRSCSPSPR